VAISVNFPINCVTDLLAIISVNSLNLSQRTESNYLQG